MLDFPWYVDIGLALGGATFIWKAVDGGIARAFLWITPKIIKLVDKWGDMILLNPVVRSFAIANRLQIEKALRETISGLQAILEAVLKEINKDLDEAAKTPGAAVEAKAPTDTAVKP